MALIVDGHVAGEVLSSVGLRVPDDDERNEEQSTGVGGVRYQMYKTAQCSKVSRTSNCNS